MGKICHQMAEKHKKSLQCGSVACAEIFLGGGDVFSNCNFSLAFFLRSINLIFRALRKYYKNPKNRGFSARAPTLNLVILAPPKAPFLKNLRLISQKCMSLNCTKGRRTLWINLATNT